MACIASKRADALEHLESALVEVARAIAKLGFAEGKGAVQVASCALAAARQAVMASRSHER
jgi:hypothetical protein